jgi:hypothetical protein
MLQADSSSRVQANNVGAVDAPPGSLDDERNRLDRAMRHILLDELLAELVGGGVMTLT